MQCEAPKIAKLVYNSNNYVYGTYNYSYWGEFKPTNITGGPNIAETEREKLSVEDLDLLY